jgi:hypothetical protein
MFAQVRGSRLGGPKDDNSKGKGWAFQDSNRHHAPPGSVEMSGRPEGFDHAWDGEGKQPNWQTQMPQTDGMPMSIGSGAGKVLQPRKGQEMEPEIVAKYDANAKVTSESSSSTSNDLQGTLEQDCQDSMTLKDFMPKCLKHTKSLIADLDVNYGDAQLETVLLNWCRSAEEFPHARGSQKVIGFRDHGSCMDFASDLKNARYFELKSTSDKGYRDFCTAFYGHHGGFEFQPAPSPPVKEQPPKQSASSWVGLSTVLVSLMLSVL